MGAVYIIMPCEYSITMSNNCTLLQAGVNDKVSHEMAEKILIEMGEFFQIQVSHLKLHNLSNVYRDIHVFHGRQV